jgi:SH3-like domain-containing protein
VFRRFCRSGFLFGVASERLWGWFLAAALCAGTLTGCSRLHPQPAVQYVYVTAKQTFLRDRVAAVAERTGTVENGQRLEVLEHGRRFYRVKTEKGELGWIDEKAVVTQEVYDGFQALRDTRKGDPAVASAVVRDEVNLHLKPGRETEKFYRLGEGDKLQLLGRATLPKPLPAGMATAKVKAGEKTPPVAMEDWWLVRDGKGRAGWLLSRMMDVDAPESLTRYAEGQRFIGAYVLTTVHDEGVEGDNKDIPIYLTVLGPYTAGLPYDFDQVRVFTWSLKMHRYETASPSSPRPHSRRLPIRFSPRIQVKSRPTRQLEWSRPAARSPKRIAWKAPWSAV